jgi:microcin C transport system substrate-binding protein
VSAFRMSAGIPPIERITVMRFRPKPLLAASLAAVAILAAACGGGSTQQVGQPAPAAAPAAAPSAVASDKNAYPVFPDADAGADPSVSAEQGGRGFTGKGWETNTNYDLIGDPRAVKGGVLREYQLDFPGTLRILGPESNTALNSLIGGLVYEALLSVHPTTLDYIPALATHWQVAPDRLTYRYRINPNARWSDGQPVTADDVVATWSFMMDKGLQDPMTQLVYGKFEKPIAESKYIVRVKSTQLNWRNFLYFSTMTTLPAHVLRTVDGARYLKEYNFKLLPGTGPYTIAEADVVKGKTVTVRRRNGYWAANQRRNVGLNNFDEIREIVVRDQNLAFEMFKKGDLDYYYVNISRQWVEELNFDRVQRGLIQKRKIFNDNPSGVQGMAFNTRKAPFDDIRFREAFAHLFNRQLMIEKLFYNEYVPLNSYYAGGIYENPDNPKMPYDPQLALKLLAETGWKERDARGRLVKDGRPLTVELLYSSKSSEPFLTVYQDDLRKVGIGLNLRLVTPETLFQLVMQRKFDVVSMAWTGLTFPNPETSYQSTLADVDNTNNISGFKDARVDALLGVYDKEFDQQKRAAIIREIDGILANGHHYLLEWDAPFQRIAYWNKFGHPDSYLTRIGDYRDIPSLWWIDPQKDARLAAAARDPALRIEVGPTEVRYWSERVR